MRAASSGLPKDTWDKREGVLNLPNCAWCQEVMVH